MAAAHIGTSGYVYNHWRGVFYPEGLPVDDWLRFYCRHFGTVEINNSFYQLPERSTFERWKNNSPRNFIFTVKFSRYLTHMKKLKEPEEPVRRFLANASGLGRKLGPLLFQLPPNFKPSIERLGKLLALRKPSMRWVFEFRNREWFAEEIIECLRAGGAGFCVHDITEGCPVIATAKFAYLRLHGGQTAAGDYDTPVLRRWSGRIDQWLDDGLDVFVYFNNDIEGYAIKNARELIGMVDPSFQPDLPPPQEQTTSSAGRARRSRAESIPLAADKPGARPTLWQEAGRKRPAGDSAQAGSIQVGRPPPSSASLLRARDLDFRSSRRFLALGFS